jgi:hypothetical protein
VNVGYVIRMDFVDVDPDDIQRPPTIDEVADVFSVPVMSFVWQDSLQELAVPSTESSSSGGLAIVDTVAISYVLWRNPDDHSDPVNLADLSDVERASLAEPPVRPLPDWFVAQRELMRYPMLWESVMTTRAAHSGHETPESTLVDHANYIVTNTFRDQRVVGGLPGVLDSPVSVRHIQYGSVRVDGVDVPGMRIDTDPHVYAVGADLGDRILTAVVARDHLEYVTVAFETRQPSASRD